MVQLAEDVVVDDGGVRMAIGQVDQRPAVVVAQQPPGGGLEGRDQVDQPRSMQVKRMGDGVDGDAVLGQRQAETAAAGASDGIEDAGVGDLLGRDGVAGGQVGAGEQVDGLLRARGDQDLVGTGGQPEAAEMVGDGLAQQRRSGRVVADAVAQLRRQWRRQHVGGSGQHLGDPRRATGRRAGQVDGGRVTLQQAGEQRVGPVGTGDRWPRWGQHGAGATAGLGHGGVAQLLVGGGDGIAADGQGLGQTALGGQPGARWQLAGLGEFLEPRGKAAKQRTGHRRPAAEQIGQLPGGNRKSGHRVPDWPSHHEANVAMLAHDDVVEQRRRSRGRAPDRGGFRREAGRHRRALAAEDHWAVMGGRPGPPSTGACGVEVEFATKPQLAREAAREVVG
jgi:hypothetical protein